MALRKIEMEKRRKMLKKTYLSIGVVIVLAFVVVATIAQIISMKSNKPALDMRARIIDGLVDSKSDIPIDIVFQNKGDKAIKLLSVFDEAIAKKIFFSVTLLDSNGTPIFSSGGGKIDLSEKSMKYVELKKGDEYAVSLSLKNFLPADYRLKPGAYSVSVIYRNQYGKDCFKGTVESNTISLHLSE